MIKNTGKRKIKMKNTRTRRKNTGSRRRRRTGKKTEKNSISDESNVAGSLRKVVRICFIRKDTAKLKAVSQMR